MLISHTPLIQEKKKKKSAAWQRSTDSSHPSVDTKGLFWGLLSNQWWDHQGLCHSLLSTRRTHWLQFYEVKMPKKKKMWRRCPQSFLSREGNAEEQASASGYWERSLRLCNRLLWVTRFCSLYLSQHHWHLHFIGGDVRESVASIPASPTEQWLCHLGSLWVLIPFPTPFSNSPWGCLFLIYI